MINTHRAAFCLAFPRLSLSSKHCLTYLSQLICCICWSFIVHKSHLSSLWILSALIRDHTTSPSWALIFSLCHHPTEPICYTWFWNKSRWKKWGYKRDSNWKQNQKIGFLTPWDFLCSDSGCQPESTGSRPKPSTRPTRPPPVSNRPPPTSPWGLIRRESCLYITCILQDSGPLEPVNYLINIVYSLQFLVEYVLVLLLSPGILS